MADWGNARTVRTATYIGAGLVLILVVLFRDRGSSMIGPSEDGVESSSGQFVEEESTQWPDTLPVRAGQSLEEVKKALGEPTASYRPADDQAGTILRYCKEGLTAGINDTEGLYFVEVREPWSKPVLGIRLGEPMSKVMESAKIHRGERWIELQGHRNWFLYTSSMADWGKYWCLEGEARTKTLEEEAQKLGLESCLSQEPQAQTKSEAVTRISFHDWTRRR